MMANTFVRLGRMDCPHEYHIPICPGNGFRLIKTNCRAKIACHFSRPAIPRVKRGVRSGIFWLVELGSRSPVLAGRFLRVESSQQQTFSKLGDIQHIWNTRCPVWTRSRLIIRAHWLDVSLNGRHVPHNLD